MLTDDELQELYENHCRFCGTQRCNGMFDEFFREGCSYYQTAINEKKFTKRTSIDPKKLYDEFVEHINSMTREELLESMRKAEEMTAGCNDDWPDDLVEVVRCKNCKHAISYTDPLEGESGLRCPLWGAAGIDPDGFCHNGKR
jgi:hypothetical protein